MRWLLTAGFAALLFCPPALALRPVVDWLPADAIDRTRPQPPALNYVPARVNNRRGQYYFRVNSLAVSSPIAKARAVIQAFAREVQALTGYPVVRLAAQAPTRVISFLFLSSELLGLTHYENADPYEPKITIRIHADVSDRYYEDVLRHELYHAIGIGHAVRAESLMAPRATNGPEHAGLSPDEVRDIRFLYDYDR